MNEHHALEQASAWVARWAPLVPPSGRVLDLACGGGRHARHFAALGHRVLAVDRDTAGLEATQGIETLALDLESGSDWPLGEERYAAIVVTNYLHRPLLSALPAHLTEDGVLIYETFMQGNERYGKPSNPAFLLEPGELLRAFSSLHTVAFEQGLNERPAVVQRYCGTRAVPATAVLATRHSDSR